MAIRFPSASDALTRDGSFLTPVLPWTHALWIAATDVAPASYYVAWLLGDPTYASSYVYVETELNVTTWYTEGFNNLVSGYSSPDSAASNTAWVYLAAVYDGASTLSLFFNSVLVGSGTIDLAIVVPQTHESLGNDLGTTPFVSSGGLVVAYDRAWQAALTSVELASEMRSATAVRRADLLADCPLTNLTTLGDLSGHGHAWTVTGAPVTFDGAEPVQPVAAFQVGSLVVTSYTPQATVFSTTSPITWGLTLAGPSGSAFCDTLDAGGFFEVGPTVDAYAATGAFLVSLPNLGIASADFPLVVRTTAMAAYVAQNVDAGAGDQQPTVQVVSAAGALTTTISLGGTIGITMLGVSRDGGTLYYVLAQGHGGPSPLVVYAYDVSGSTSSSFASETYGGSDVGLFVAAILGLPDASVLIAWSTQNSGERCVTIVRHYAADGTLLATWPQTQTGHSGGAPGFTLASSLTPDRSFWVGAYTEETTQFDELGLSDGVSRQTLVTPLPAGDLTHTSPAFFIWRGNNAPPHAPIATIDVPIRRLRRAPHLTQEQVRIIYDSFQVDLQPGIGTVDVPAPQLMLRYSDDGGFTWSQPIQMAAGGPGNYVQRCLAFRLGQARDRVFEVSTTDPVAWTLIAAYLKIRPGTS